MNTEQSKLIDSIETHVLALHEENKNLRALIRATIEALNAVDMCEYAHAIESEFEKIQGDHHE